MSWPGSLLSLFILSPATGLGGKLDIVCEMPRPFPWPGDLREESLQLLFQMLEM